MLFRNRFLETDNCLKLSYTTEDFIKEEKGVFPMQKGAK